MRCVYHNSKCDVSLKRLRSGSGWHPLQVCTIVQGPPDARVSCRPHVLERGRGRALGPGGRASVLLPSVLMAPNQVLSLREDRCGPRSSPVVEGPVTWAAYGARRDVGLPSAPNRAGGTSPSIPMAFPQSGVCPSPVPSIPSGRNVGCVPSSSVSSWREACGRFCGVHVAFSPGGPV